MTNPSKTILVDILEDDLIIRTNLQRYLNLAKDLQCGVVGSSFEQYKEQVLETKIASDILLLDIGLPGISGLDAIPQILALNPKISIIILTTYEEERMILKAMSTGAVAYISKKTTLKDIMEAIRVVSKGGSYMSPMIARDIFNFMLKSQKAEEEDLLTERQLEVLENVVKGKSYNVIGRELFISHETVRTHIKNIYVKLQVKNKAEAIATYFEKNLQNRSKGPS